MLSANHKSGYVRRLQVERGQTVRSLTQIGDACGISRKAVRYALSVLERDGFISKDEPFGAQQGHRITICKYNDYQLDPSDKGTVGAQQGTQEGTHAGNTNNNEKNGKRQKETQGEGVKLDVKLEADCIAILRIMNEKTGRNYRAVTPNLRARVRESGRDACEKVVRFKSAEWLGTEQEQYIRPTTLFQPSKFDGYLAAAEYAENNQPPPEPIPSLPKWRGPNGYNTWAINIHLGATPVVIPAGTYAWIDDCVNRPDWHLAVAGELSNPHQWYCIETDQELPL
jgi:uncharacterized phage protein (TIGR02220 family)